MGTRRPDLQTDTLHNQPRPVVATSSAVINTITGDKSSLHTLRSGPKKATWEISTTNDFFCLAQGRGKYRLPSKLIEGTDTIFVVSKPIISKGKKITCANFICDIKLSKTETPCVPLAVGGDKLTYDGGPIYPAISLLDLRIHLNFVISYTWKGAHYLTADIINYYLNNPMANFQYMRIHLKDIPNEVIVDYSLLPIADANGYVYVDIRKGIYGLKEASIITYKRLVRNLQPHGYAPVAHTYGLWTHSTLPTTFTLAADDFGIKFFAANDSTHLLGALRKNYYITVDPSCSKYCKITIKWNYPRNYVDISMTNSVSKSLERFQHPVPMLPRRSSHKRLAPTYGAKVQYSPDATTAPKLDKRGITHIQSIAGIFLYISRTVDPTMLVALNEINANKASPTTDTIKKTKMLMDYADTQLDAIIRFHISNIGLHTDSDTAYLVHPKSRSRAARHYHLSDNPPPPHIRPTPTPNGPILTKFQTIRTFMDSAAEAETGAIFLNGQQAVPICTSLIKMGHLQPPTPIKTNSATSYSILAGKMRWKRSKAFDMRFHWMRCRIK